MTLDVEGFRAYLQEMVGLGVLTPNNDGHGWHLRSPNVLHMIGSKDGVITQLVGAATLSVPDEFIVLETRLALPDGRRSPLTAGRATTCSATTPTRSASCSVRRRPASVTSRRP